MRQTLHVRPWHPFPGTQQRTLMEVGNGNVDVGSPGGAGDDY